MLQAKAIQETNKGTFYFSFKVQRPLFVCSSPFCLLIQIGSGDDAFNIETEEQFAR